MMSPSQIVVASADLEARRSLMRILTQQGFEPIATSTVRECLQIMGSDDVALLFCDRHLADGSYRDVLSACRSQKTRVRVVLTSRHHEWDEYLEAMRLGAFDVIASPCRSTDVEWMILQARRDERTRARQVIPLRAASPGYSEAARESA
jgi:DNA-binding NtrC family response regulator